MTIPTDWRALCAELADSVELLLEMRPTNAKPMAITEDRLSRARVALAQPEPQEPTDKLNTAALEYAQAVLDLMCWGQDQQNKETTSD